VQDADPTHHNNDKHVDNDNDRGPAIDNHHDHLAARYHLDVDEFDLHRPQRKHVYDIDEPCDDDDCTREHVHVLTVDDLHNIVRAAYDWASHHWSAGPLHDEPDYDAILAAAHSGASVDDPA